MTTNIQSCTYRPNSAVPETAVRKIELLRQGGAQEISSKVGKIIRQHLGYTGKDVYTLQLTKTKITFTVNGQTSTLEYDGTAWKLTKPDRTTGTVSPESQGKIAKHIDKTLAKIHTAWNDRDPDASSPSISLPRIPIVSDRELESLRGDLPIHDSTLDRLLEAQKRTNAGVEHICRTLDELLGLFKAGKTTSSEADGRIRALQDELTSLGRALQESKSELEKTRHASSSSNERVGELEKLLQAKEQLLEDLRATLRGLSAELDQAKQTNATQAAVLQATQADVKKKEEAIRTLKDQLAKNDASIKAQSATIEDLEQQLKVVRQSQTEHGAALENAQSEAAKLKEEKNALLAQLEGALGQIKALKGELTSTQGFLETAQSTNKKLEASNGELTKKIATLEQKIKDFEKTREANKEQITSLGTQNKDLTNLLNQVRGEKEVLVKEKERLIRELSDARTLNEKQNLELRELLKQLEAMQAKRAGQTLQLTAQLSSTTQSLAEAAKQVAQTLRDKKFNSNLYV